MFPSLWSLVGEALPRGFSVFAILHWDLGTWRTRPVTRGPDLAPGDRHCHLAVRTGQGDGCEPSQILVGPGSGKIVSTGVAV